MWSSCTVTLNKVNYRWYQNSEALKFKVAHLNYKEKSFFKGAEMYNKLIIPYNIV